MATITKGQTFSSTEQITNTKLHNLVDLATVSGIVNADLDAGAAIADTKLATITTAGTVMGTAIAGLTGLPAGAGAIPVANLPTGTIANKIVKLDADAKIPAIDGSLLTSLNASELDSGTVPVARIDTGTTANKIVQLDATAKLPAVDGSQLTNVSAGSIVFSFGLGGSNFVANGQGIAIDTSPTPANTDIMCVAWAVYGNNYRTVLTTKFKKTSGISTVTIYANLWSNTGVTGNLKVDIGGQNNSVASDASATPAWKNFDIDVSSLTNGTFYDVTIQLASSLTTTLLYMDSIIAFSS